MSVSAHLGINIDEYDARIRTFIPHYEEMLDTVAAALPRSVRTIVDLGTGTGALAARCLRDLPDARVLGIDSDSEMLRIAAQRLGPRAELVCAIFEAASLPQCDAVIASFSLHHVADLRVKEQLYRRIREALNPAGVLLIADCHPAADPTIATAQFAAWKTHLGQTYSSKEAQDLLDAWSHEDFYMPLDVELDCLRAAGFDIEILWRKDAFAVLRGTLHHAL